MDPSIFNFECEFSDGLPTQYSQQQQDFITGYVKICSFVGI